MHDLTREALQSWNVWHFVFIQVSPTGYHDVNVILLESLSSGQVVYRQAPIYNVNHFSSLAIELRLCIECLQLFENAYHFFRLSSHTHFFTL